MARKSGLAALTAKSQHDPVLGALFSSSIGPASRPDASRYSKAKLEAEAEVSRRARASADAAAAKKEEEEEDGEEDDEKLSSADEELDDDDNDDNDDEEEDEDDDDDDDDDETENKSDGEDEQEADDDSAMNVDDAHVAEVTSGPKTSRKRKRKDDTDDLEDRYLKKLAKEEEAEDAAREKKSEVVELTEAEGSAEDSSAEADDDDDDEIPAHESIDPSSKIDDEVEKANRTVFLSNVSIKAAASPADKKIILTHLSTVLDTSPESTEKVESIRFRSLPFSDAALPKRAAYITGALMDSTTHSCNAYVVYSTAAAARRAVSKLNGVEVLERHLRVDSVAHPSPTDHHRCVFVGNLVYMDDETITTKNAKGETVTKKRGKKPADVEEGLWRVFGQQGRRVENVRVPRDPKTRVGKGFAYVQFYNQNDVESALLLDGKKFPPMLPRGLRVTRAKPPHRTALAMERNIAKKAGFTKPHPRDGKYVPKLTQEQKSLEGRAARLFGRSAVMRPKFGKASGRFGTGGGVNSLRSPEAMVAEGRRASAKDGRPDGMKIGRPQRAKGAGRRAATKSRSSQRAADWRKKGKA